ncbi:putative quinol monooxygenase [Arthrobacter mobilis]|uniref:Antibiotic biosynthesis monooxygenase n=1 Tax=Arthrobacter mobilis TaxID=2724944 RepID=A0A7X6HGQ8_9MICC|nr:antibiotic biosynthesis monooxygenase family protein [Arthrobacter mobilis]NKX55919.1 antibiotic biosynthesis monooxygenase [Arthrobacter mobilis]
MSVTAIATLTFKPECLEEAQEAVGRTLKFTRTFDGCLGVDVLIDRVDETRWLLVESWESAEHNAAYLSYRSSQGVKSELAPFLAGPPSVAKYDLSHV